MTSKTYKFANDLGYSSMKIDLNNNVEKIPSVMTIQRPQNYTKAMEFNNNNERDMYFQNLKNEMDVSITSPSVKLQGRFLVGQRALDSGLPTRAFDVNDYNGKSESDLAVILTLSTLATQRIQDAYQNKEDFSKVLKMNVDMTTALPITESKKDNVSDNYEKRYTTGKHIVSLYNFGQPINVEINFNDHVYVGFEGEMAQFKIRNADNDLKKEIKDSFDKAYPDLKNDVTIDDLIESKNVMGIDIGEGTTDFSMITDGQANATISNSLEEGYGNVLQDAVAVLQQEKFNFHTRNELNDFLSQKVSPLAKNRQRHAQQVVYDQLNQLVDRIIDATSETMRHSNNNTELVYVYGGGSIPLSEQTDMRERLIEKLKGFAGGYDIPVIWINKKRAQTLNEDGLKLALNSMFE